MTSVPTVSTTISPALMEALPYTRPQVIPQVLPLERNENPAVDRFESTSHSRTETSRTETSLMEFFTIISTHLSPNLQKLKKIYIL